MAWASLLAGLAQLKLSDFVAQALDATYGRIDMVGDAIGVLRYVLEQVGDGLHILRDFTGGRGLLLGGRGNLGDLGIHLIDVGHNIIEGLLNAVGLGRQAIH